MITGVELEEYDVDWWEASWDKGGDIDFGPLGTATVVASQPGREGGGENIWIVFEINGQTFRKTGWYASYDGSTWDGAIEEVESYQETVTFYRPKV